MMTLNEKGVKFEIHAIPVGNWMLFATPPLSFLVALVFFHASELALAFIYSRPDVSRKNFLVTKPYCVALAAGVIEYGFEERHLGGWKTEVVRMFGAAMVLCGELIRKLAMVTAKGNFTHKMIQERKETHKLITHGIYSWVRHPGYLGWMMWAIGMQMLLVNPVCVVVCTYVILLLHKNFAVVEILEGAYFFGGRLFARVFPWIIRTVFENSTIRRVSFFEAVDWRRAIQDI